MKKGTLRIRKNVQVITARLVQQRFVDGNNHIYKADCSTKQVFFLVYMPVLILPTEQ